MTQKQQVIDFMKDKDRVHLKDIYCIAGLKPSTVRAIINADVKQGKTFDRLGKGFYKLK